jgi:hypothetical protein
MPDSGPSAGRLPVRPGTGRRPEKLAGRDRDLESFRVLLERLGEGRHDRSIYSPS